jgi:5'-3' exonuclease
MAVPSMNADGMHTGGIAGFLKSVGYAIKLIGPTRVIVVFDGTGGSQKRRKIYPGYKNGRKTRVRFNRAYEEMSGIDNEEKNLRKELLRLINYLDVLPVTTISIDNIEADDTIAYLADQTFKTSNVTIMSSDKDFLQLANDRIKIWSPTKKKIFGCKEIVDEYGVSCGNFIFYRAMQGDVSDNIPGLSGAGSKTILKCFPFLADEQKTNFQEIYNYAENHKGRYKLYDRVLDEKLVFERNYELMQLNTTQIQSFTQLRIEEIIQKKVPVINKIAFSKLINEDKMWHNLPNYNVWLGETYNKLNSFVS